MIDFETAVAMIRAVAVPLGTQSVGLADAHGRVLARGVEARLAAPRADVSAMDGYAVADTGVQALPAWLTVIGESFPGQGFPGSVSAGTAVRIFTGAPVPAGADRVVMQEDARRDGDRVEIVATDDSRHVRRAGSDFAAGDMLLDAGTLMTPRALVAAGAADVGEVTVFRRPRLMLIATGDELADPGTAAARAGAVPESVSLGVAALARDWGAEPVGALRLADDLALMAEPARQAAAACDLVVVTGGASVGERDFAKAMFGDGLELVFSRVAMKPGKPVWLGRIGTVLVMGLPGNPSSAMVTARLLLAPLVAGLSGRDPGVALRWRSERLAEAVGAAGDRETFSRGALAGDGVRLAPNQDSGAQRTLAAAALLVRRPAGVRGFAAGDRVDTLDF